MSVTFIDFNDILELIQNKDPLDLNSESYQTAKSETSSETNMDKYDAIPHYLKSNTINVNNSADTDQTRPKTSPTLQVNIPSTQTRHTHSISSGNLAKSTASFKSFENMQQS